MISLLSRKSSGIPNRIRNPHDSLCKLQAFSIIKTERHVNKEENQIIVIRSVIDSIELLTAASVALSVLITRRNSSSPRSHSNGNWLRRLT